jgi:hypothetical protein
MFQVVRAELLSEPCFTFVPSSSLVSAALN